MMKRLFLLLTVFGLMQPISAQTLRRGDLDGDGEVTLTDLTKLANILVGHHEYVDLGLPSGTLWATTNIGANFPEEYGQYFAYGETESKSDYSWTTYKWCEGTATSMTKYCLSDSYGMVDSLNVLNLEDDAAYMLWGSEWRIPTNAQLNELSENNVTWDFSASENGVAGIRLTSKANGNSIFLPYAGFYIGTTLTEAGRHVAIRGSNVSDKNVAGYFRWWQSGTNVKYDGTRCYGVTIRPVRMPSE